MKLAFRYYNVRIVNNDMDPFRVINPFLWIKECQEYAMMNFIHVYQHVRTDENGSKIVCFSPFSRILARTRGKHNFVNIPLTVNCQSIVNDLTTEWRTVRFADCN